MRRRGKEEKEGIEMALTRSDLQAIQGLLQPINERLDGIDSRLDGMDERFDRMDNRLDGIENRLDKVESEVSSLKSGQLEIRKELKEVDRKVSGTYDLALEAWGKARKTGDGLKESVQFSGKSFREGMCG